MDDHTIKDAMPMVMFFDSGLPKCFIHGKFELIKIFQL